MTTAVTTAMAGENVPEEAKRAVRMREYTKAAGLFQGLAEQGDADAQYQLGILYQQGKGVPKDHEQAFQWFQKAAESGHVKAQYSLATMYENGWGVTADEQYAASWYQKAADQGYPQAIARVKEIQVKGFVSERKANFSREELFLLAAGDGDIPGLGRSIDGGVDINTRDRFGRTALMEAVRNGYGEVVRFLIQKGADPEIFNSEGDNALLIAAGKGSDELARVLVDAGAGIDAANRYGYTPLMLAVQRDDLALVEFFLGHGCDVARENVEGQNALHIARVKGYEDIVQRLLATGKVALVSPKQKEDSLAAVVAKLKTAKELNENAPFGKWPPLSLAAWRGETELVRHLLAGGVDVNAVSTDGYTALSLASWKGHDEAVEILLDAKAKMFPAADENISALVLAAQNGHDGVVRRLLEGYPAVIQDAPGIVDKAMHAAIEDGHGKVVQAILRQGVLLSIPESKKAPYLLSAAKKGDVAMIDIFLDYGVDINTIDEDGKTALILAAEAGQGDVVQYLLEKKGVALDLRDHQGHTALLAAAATGREDIVSLLVKTGSAIDIPDAGGNTPLLLAAGAGHSAIVEELIRKGARVDATNAAGNSALVAAIKREDKVVAKILLDHGANPYLPLKKLDHISEEMKELLGQYRSTKKWLKEIF